MNYFLGVQQRSTDPGKLHVTVLVACKQNCQCTVIASPYQTVCNIAQCECTAAGPPLAATSVCSPGGAAGGDGADRLLCTCNIHGHQVGQRGGGTGSRAGAALAAAAAIRYRVGIGPAITDGLSPLEGRCSENSILAAFSHTHTMTEGTIQSNFAMPSMGAWHDSRLFPPSQTCNRTKYPPSGHTQSKTITLARLPSEFGVAACC